MVIGVPLTLQKVNFTFIGSSVMVTESPQGTTLDLTAHLEPTVLGLQQCNLVPTL